jgi:hypothetical protein
LSYWPARLEIDSLGRDFEIFSKKLMGGIALRNYEQDNNANSSLLDYFAGICREKGWRRGCSDTPSHPQHKHTSPPIHLVSGNNYAMQRRLFIGIFFPPWVFNADPKYIEKTRKKKISTKNCLEIGVFSFSYGFHMFRPKSFSGCNFFSNLSTDLNSA